jgi:hypothetical protein
MPSGDTLEIKTFNDLGELDGRYVAFWHDNGEMREQGEFKNGRRHGAWQKWFRSGQLEYEREYDRGRFVGRWTDFNFDGQVASSHEFLTDLPAELAKVWGEALVDGVPTGTSQFFQRRDRQVDTIPAEEREYSELRKNGLDWIVSFKSSSPRFAALYKPRYDTLYVWRHHPIELAR